MELLDERIELHPPPASLDPEPRRGHDAVRQYLTPDVFEWQEAEPLELIEHSNRILVVAHVRARGRGSGVELDDVAYHLWTVEGERAVRFQALLDRTEALAALRAG